ncbi:Hypp8901 [Branchiostoma lanceolatum]|uniref:Hypp8901 protein n=1 Tax=Branchiostoma lanceolatum TaxID=7740 RepID=A0A8J9ZA38_BRALA|nr:Hypp8901 [Branchiostoma lanceolatum]
MAPSEIVRWRLERLARSTHVSKLVSSFEALASRPRHDYTAAAGMTPFLAMPDDSDQVLIRHRRSIQEIKDELVGKASSTSSEASVVNVTPQKPPSAKLLREATPKSAGTTEQQKPLPSQSLADTTAQTSEPDTKTVSSDTTGTTTYGVKPKDLLRTPVVLGDAAGETTVMMKTSCTQSVVSKDDQTTLAVRQDELLRTLLLGLPDATAETTITVSPRKPVHLQSLADTDAKTAVPVKEPASTPSLTVAAARATESAPVLQPPQKPYLCEDYVFQRGDLGHFGFSVLTTMTPDMERVHVVFQAADSTARLPVGLLVSANFISVKNMTASELQYIFDRCTESVLLRVQQLSFPLAVLQEMVADQTYRRQRRAHPVKRWVKRKLTGVARALSRVRDAITFCR